MEEPITVSEVITLISIFFSIIALFVTFFLNKKLEEGKHENNQNLEELKLYNNKKLEDFKIKNQIVFLKLHEKQANFICDLYININKIQSEFLLLTDVGRNDYELDLKEMELKKLLYEGNTLLTNNGY